MAAPIKKPAEAESLPDKDVLTQQDIVSGVNTVEDTGHQHAPLEIEVGKNNGAEPAAFRGQQKYQT
jgi:hypothetical protein